MSELFSLSLSYRQININKQMSKIKWFDSQPRITIDKSLNCFFFYFIFYFKSNE